MGGGDEKENLIDLYAREHFEAHRLLALENPNENGLVYAWWMMAHVNSDNQGRYELSHEEYEEARIANARIRKEKFSGKGNPMYGKVHTEEAKQKNRKAHIGKRASEETKKKMSESMSGDKNPNYDKHHSDETRKKQSKRAKERLKDPQNHPNYGKPMSEEQKQKLSKSQRGKHNGEKNPNYDTGKHVIQLSLGGDYIAEYISAAEAEKITGIYASSIRQCCNHSPCRKKAGGFLWMFKDEYEQLQRQQYEINGKRCGRVGLDK